MKTVKVLGEVLSGKRMSERSRENYRAVFRSLGKMYEEFPLKTVQVNSWLVSLEGYADQMVRLWFTILRGAGEFMEVNYGIPNPCKGMKTPKVQKKRRRYFNAKEIMKIIQAFKSDYGVALVMTLVDSSCRIGGLPYLRGRDVGEGWINVKVKEKTGERKYRLDERVCEVLRGLAGGGDGLVFGLSSNALSMRMIRICKRAGIRGEKLGAHTFRHSSASLVTSETENVMTVKALLQHDSVQTSMVYIHDVEEDIQKRISPLKLVSDRVMDSGMHSHKQLTTGEKNGGGEAAGYSVMDDIMGDMFPEVADVVVVRSLLRAEDLILIRKGFIDMAKNGRYAWDVGRARELMKRMLRKVR